jgi:hypothetical protein
MPLRDHWWCILVAKYGAFLFTEIGAVVITDYRYIFFEKLQRYYYLCYYSRISKKISYPLKYDKLFNCTRAREFGSRTLANLFPKLSS